MLFSPSFLRAGCCALALQIATSFPSVAMTGDEETRGSKTAAPMARLDKTDPSYSGVKSLIGQEPTADQIAAYPEFNAFFKSGSYSPTRDHFTDYLAAKAADISTIKDRYGLYDYQEAKKLLGAGPTAAQFADFGDFKKVFSGGTYSPAPIDFTDYLAAKAADISTIKSKYDLYDYQAAKKLLGTDPTAAQFADFGDFKKVYNGSIYDLPPGHFTDYLAAKAAGISTIKSKYDLYDYQEAKKFLGADPTAIQFADFGDFKKVFNGSIYDLPPGHFTDYLAAKAAGISTIKSKYDLYDYQAAKKLLGTDPTAAQFADFGVFKRIFSSGMYEPKAVDFIDYLAAKTAGISTIKSKYDLYDYQAAKKLLGADPTAAQFEVYNKLKKENNYHREPTKAEIEERVKKGS